MSAPSGRVSGDTIAPGSLLAGRYHLGDRLGAGGMATIYRAWDDSLERHVAVKVLHAHLADDPALQARFRTEARHAAALLHPHIVNVFDQGVADLPYIVMEYIDGPSLRDVLLARGRLLPAETLAVLVPVCQALARAHAAGVVHRDVKPENVLVSADGVPKVADFGIARAVAATSHTQTGALIGSVHYLAPELVDGREATAASDQYALGVLLFELLTGRKPLPGDSPMAVALRHAREKVPAPSRFVSDVSRSLDRVVRRATAADPADRYPDVLAFAVALGQAVPEGPADVVVPPPDEASGEDTLVIPAAAQDTMAVEEAAAVGDRARTRREHGRRLLRRAAMAVGVLLLVAGLGAGGAYAYWNYVVAPYVAIPELVGNTADQARSAAGEQGFEMVVAERVHDLDHPAGEVLGQEPAAGELRRRGAELSLVVSKGPKPIDMPDVVGKAAGKARDRLERDFLDVSVQERFNDTVPAGKVIAQKPAAGNAIRQGGEATLTVSLGIEQVTVPELAGLSRDEAAAALEQAGLGADVATRYSDEVPDPGTVIGQDVAADREVDKGSVVTVTVSLGPLTFAVPNVRGQPIEEARAALTELGLEVSVEGVPRPSFGPFRRGELGLVEEQLPQPEESVQRGDSVRLFTYVDE